MGSLTKEFTHWPQPRTELTVDLEATTTSIPFVGSKDAFDYCKLGFEILIVTYVNKPRAFLHHV